MAIFIYSFCVTINGACPGARYKILILPFVLSKDKTLQPAPPLFPIGGIRNDSSLPVKISFETMSSIQVVIFNGADIILSKNLAPTIVFKILYAFYKLQYFDL